MSKFFFIKYFFLLNIFFLLIISVKEINKTNSLNLEEFNSGKNDRKLTLEDSLIKSSGIKKFYIILFIHIKEKRKSGTLFDGVPVPANMTTRDWAGI